MTKEFNFFILPDASGLVFFFLDLLSTAPAGGTRTRSVGAGEAGVA